MGDMAEYYDERAEYEALLDEEHNQREREDMQRAHVINKAKPRWSWIRCSVCGRQTKKGHPSKATCSRKCLDTYHNTISPRGLGPRQGGWKTK